MDPSDKFQNSNSKFQTFCGRFGIWDQEFVICYFIKMLLNLGMFLSAIPVPRTTALSGSSAM